MIFSIFSQYQLCYYYLLTFLIHAYLAETAQVPKLLDAAKILRLMPQGERNVV